MGLLLLVASVPGYAHNPGDPWTAHYMWRRYYNTDAPCNATRDMADYLCVGILMRGTHPKEATHSWWPEPKSVSGSRSSGGVSFSFIRTDIKAPHLAYSYPNGYTLLPQMGKYKAPPGKQQLTVLCAFPQDAYSDVRDQSGCGATVQWPTTSAPCNIEGITTGQQWVNAYPTRGNGQQICGFALGQDQSRGALKPFIDASVLLSSKGKLDGNNEMRIATWPATDASSQTMPLESFFYLAGNATGLSNAQADQLDYYNSTKQFIPIIQITLPTAAASDYDFHYNKADQNPRVPIPVFPAKDPLPCDNSAGGFDLKC